MRPRLLVTRWLLSRVTPVIGDRGYSGGFAAAITRWMASRSSARPATLSARLCGQCPASVTRGSRSVFDLCKASVAAACRVQLHSMSIANADVNGE